MAQIEVENVLQPGTTYRVDAEKYAAMRSALMAVMPDRAPGMTPAALQKALLAHLDPQLFPGGEKAGWWMKCAQLDLEAKGVIRRAEGAPVRLFLAVSHGGT
ncbi:MAG: DUF6958 family protein [Paracoccaceae bacterium]